MEHNFWIDSERSSPIGGHEKDAQELRERCARDAWGEHGPVFVLARGAFMRSCCGPCAGLSHIRIHMLVS